MMLTRFILRYRTCQPCMILRPYTIAKRSNVFFKKGEFFQVLPKYAIPRIVEVTRKRFYSSEIANDPELKALLKEIVSDFETKQSGEQSDLGKGTPIESSDYESETSGSDSEYSNSDSESSSSDSEYSSSDSETSGSDSETSSSDPQSDALVDSEQSTEPKMSTSDVMYTGQGVEKFNMSEIKKMFQMDEDNEENEDIEEYELYDRDVEHVDVIPSQPFPIELDRGQSGVFDVDDLVTLLKAENADDVISLDIPAELHWVDHMVIVSGKSTRHLIAMAELVKWTFKRKRSWFDVKSVKIEGLDTCEDWLAMDLGNIALHLFLPSTRRKYDLETLWTKGTDRTEEETEQKDLSSHGDPFAAFLSQDFLTNISEVGDKNQTRRKHYRPEKPFSTVEFRKQQMALQLRKKRKGKPKEE